jgi:oxygen-independent coproporphyrinogen III oxidase
VIQNNLINSALINQYDIPGPRYTSYPTADRFVEATDLAHVPHLGLMAEARADGCSLSLYFHIPFCDTVCFYCACNKIATKNRELGSRYVDYLLHEMSLKARHFQRKPHVVQMHWGGGTPTFLSDLDTQRLVDGICEFFDLDPAGEHSIEIDPRRADAGRIARLADAGFNRISVGVQDFDSEVQAAVNRRQSVEETAEVIRAARAHGFRSVSMDLIYGLPHQSPSRFDRTLDTVLELAPDRLSLYSYAHLPARFMPQRRIQAEHLPTPADKLGILERAVQRLLEAGYVYIGMDHFARPDDELAVAQRQGTLHRNFQGYSTHADCDLLAFGVSSIGMIDNVYVQNHKSLDDYYAALDEGKLPTARGWVLSEDDRLRRHIIQSLMCHFELSFADLETAFPEEFACMHGATFGARFGERFEAELAELAHLEAAGLVRILPDRLLVTDAGRFLVRVVAMAFDAHLRASAEAKRYSRVI